MQPVIDIINELAKKYIDTYLATHPAIGPFIDRGDPVEWDWELSDLVEDGNWHDLNLSSIVPDAATQVKFQLTHRSTTVNDRFMLRQNGNVNTYNISVLRCYVANLYSDHLFLVTPDLVRKVEYRFVGVGCDFLRMTVCGWWLKAEAVIGFVNRGDPAAVDFTAGDFTIDSAWHVLDLSAIVPANTSAVLMRCRVKCNSANRWIYFRPVWNINFVNRSQCQVVSANDDYYYDIVVPTLGIAALHYLSNIADFPVIELTVKGWWY